MAKLSALTSSRCEVRIGKILGDLELAPIVSIRRTFSQDAMLKAYLLLRLKNIKSFRALVNYLKNRPEEALNIGFDKNENGVIIPSQQDIWHFAKTLDKEGLVLVDFIVATIKEAAEKFNLILDSESLKPAITKDIKSKKTLYNYKNNKSKGLVSFVKERLKKKLKFKLWLLMQQAGCFMATQVIMVSRVQNQKGAHIGRISF